MSNLTKTMALMCVASLAACGNQSPSENSSSSSSSPSSTFSSTPFSSSSSSSISSSSSSSSSSSLSSSPSSPSTPWAGGVRPAKLIGYGSATTGGKGGKTVTVKTGTELHKALCDRSSSDEPLIIKVNGTINHGNTSRQKSDNKSCDTADDRISLKNVSNVSIIGVGNSGVLDQIGIFIGNSKSGTTTGNIIIQNLTIKNVRKSNTNNTSNGGDAISMEGKGDGRSIANIWIDHNTIHGSTAAGEEHDGLVDMKKGVQNVTVSYNYLHTAGRGSMVGFSDGKSPDDTKLTYHHNWWRNLNQRTPLLRHGHAHIFNNYYQDIQPYHAINSRQGAEILIEGNYFQKVIHPIISTDSKQKGCWDTDSENVFVDTEYTRTVGKNALDIPKFKDGQAVSTCSVSVSYGYDLDRADQVPAIVKANAGAGKI